MVLTNAVEAGNGSPPAPHQSSQTSVTLSPSWGPPKSPLSPHRLAKLANALGVSTPIPLIKSPNQFLSRSFSESSDSPIDLRRSPTPSATASSMGFTAYPPSTSKYLLHVIPPNHLPHDSENPDENSLLPPPPNTPGYHTQFRRGTLIPVHSTLQAQLVAVAREYALPSSAGLTLYLITSSPQGLSPHQMEMEEPGPRLSEDIWRHLWTRVLSAEQRDDLLMPSLSPRSASSPMSLSKPNIFGFPPAARSTPFLPQESTGLRPLLAVAEQPSPQLPQISSYMNPAPSTTSSLSEMRSGNKSAPTSSPSISHSEPGTPDTSIEDAGARLDLPGLNSPSLIPILAKVEFDIDRRKAPWYEPWRRSRMASHAKRSESRKNSRSESRYVDGEDESRKYVPVEFLTGKKNRMGLSDLSLPASEDKEEESGYAELPDSPQGIGSDGSDSNSEMEETSEDATAKISSLSGGKDPLDDVFGTDADAWADIHAENTRQRSKANPLVVNLALTAQEFDALPSPSSLEEDKESTKEEDEVMEMLDIMGKPQLAMAIPSPAKNKRLSPQASASSRKVPPPLVLKPKDKSGPNVIASQPSPRPSTADSSHLAYLGEPSEREQGNSIRVRSPDADKRIGAVFDDLDLGLDPTEDFDEDDPNDRRRSQLIMKKQLDEIERTMAQLSPRILKTDLEEEQNTSFSSTSLSPGSPSTLTLSPGILGRSSGPPPASPRLPRHENPPDEPRDFAGQSWPAVPFSVIKDKSSEVNPNAPPSPPRLAVNGVTTSAPRSYQPSPTPSNLPSETERRKKLEAEEVGALYPPSIISSQAQSSLPVTPVSPIIPLSPDPFGRHPSSPEPPQSLQISGPQWDNITVGKDAIPGVIPEHLIKGRARSGTTSRFSADSLNGEEVISSKPNNRGTLMSVKSIRKLWRKSSNKSASASTSQSVPPTPSAQSSGRTSPFVPPQRPERPSEEQILDLPDIPDMPAVNFGRVSPQMGPPVPRTSQESVAPGRRPSLDQQMTPHTNLGRVSPQTIPPRRDSLSQSRRPSTDLLNAHPQPQQFQQLSVPAFSGRAPNGGPITTPHMQATRASSNFNALHFDQESPYPVRPIRQSPRPPSPPPLPAIPEKDKPVARKSILKWKSTASIDRITPDASSETQPRTSLERLSGNARGRRPSVTSFGGSVRSSVTSPDLPPSPQIPAQFISVNTKNGLEHRQSQRSRLTTSSTDSSSSPPPRQNSLQSQPSPPRSRASSRDSRESRPSFDVSQFEFVSPKMGMLGYPYNALDQ